MSLNCSLIGVLIFLTLTISVADAQNVANFQRAFCIPNDESLFVNYSCSTKPVNRYKTVLNMRGYLAKRLDTVLLHHQMYKKTNVIYRPFLINVTEDFCKRFVNKSKSPYLNILMDFGQKFSNLNHTCPYDGWLIIKELELDLSGVNLLFPEGEYRYDLEPFVNKAQTPSFALRFFFQIGGKIKN